MNFIQHRLEERPANGQEANPHISYAGERETPLNLIRTQAVGSVEGVFETVKNYSSAPNRCENSDWA